MTFDDWFWAIGVVFNVLFAGIGIWVVLKNTNMKGKPQESQMTAAQRRRARGVTKE